MKGKIALCQMIARSNVEDSYRAAKALLDEAGKNKADIAVLPEIWTIAFTPKNCLDNAEEIGGRAYTLLQNAAKEYGMYVFGGSFPVRHGDKVDNACFIFDPDGNEIGRYDKTHLFDVEVDGMVTAKESGHTVPGDHPLVVDTAFGKIGMLICYDLRFPQMFFKLADMGAEMIVLSAAFHIDTGKAHWDFLTKARAVDTQVYLAAVCGATDPEAAFVTYGHSRLVDPWGEVITELGYEEGVGFAEFDTERVTQIRNQLPTLKSRRPELY